MYSMLCFIAIVYHVTGSYFLNSFFPILCCSYNSSVSNVCQACNYGSVIPELNWRPSSSLVLSNPSKWDSSYAVLTVGRTQLYHSQDTEWEAAERSGGGHTSAVSWFPFCCWGKHCDQKQLGEDRVYFSSQRVVPRLGKSGHGGMEECYLLACSPQLIQPA